ESSSTNNPSAAATVTVGSTPVSITLHLIKQKKKFDCYHGTDGLLAYEENIFNNYEDTDGTAGYSRPGLTRAAQVTNDLWAHYTGIGSKASDTDPSSGVHASVQLQSLGSNPSVKVIENLPSYEGMIYRAGIKISPDARFGNYAAICSGGGEYALISNLIEVKENGGSFINLELLREMSDQFDYTKDGLIGSVDNKDQSPRLPGVAGPPLRVPDQKAIPILLNQMRNWEVALAVLLIFTSFLYFWSRRSGLQRWIVSSATLGIAFLACTKAPTTAGEFASLDEGGVTYETISYYLGAWAEGAWTSMSETDEPLGREGHSAIWNGSEMIVFGGSAEMDAYLQDGARYNPETDTWSAISTTNSASARAGHGAVWTGSKMLIWGGRNEEGALATGASYDSDADTWTAITTTNAPAARVEHSTVWTGTEMIVWGGWGGGAALSSGARYNPTTDTWTALSTVNAPSARYGHRAVWTGTEMIVWGGDSGSAKLNTGAIYNPANDTWTTISTTGAPEARSHFGMAYITGGNVHIFGGEGASLFLETHVSYDHTTDSWTELQNLGTNIGHPTVAVTGTTFYFTHGLRSRENLSPDLGVGYLNFYANTFFSYNPSENAIEVSAEDEPPRNLNPRRGSTMVWTGSQLLIWGGSGSDFIADNVSRLGRGAVFTP
ncbi:MAG: Kelch repeat-containing protein, partial [Pseudobdellovibrionaceae bacterium]